MDEVSHETYRGTDGALVEHDEASLDDDGVVQRDEEMRFSRYRDTIGEGRFKVVYKGFDERNGLDIAWGIISGDVLGLDGSTMQQLLQETQRNTKLKHKNIIRCFKCWHSGNQINLITELFTSGNLREFIQEHKQLGADALRKFSKQILEGIDYLHSQDPPVIHGDLRCDKIYVNGNEGTVKIGDLGLVTLLARRYAASEPGSAYQALADHADAVRHSPDYDVYSFGLCMLEMYSQVCPSGPPSPCHGPGPHLSPAPTACALVYRWSRIPRQSMTHRSWSRASVMTGLGRYSPFASQSTGRPQQP